MVCSLMMGWELVAGSDVMFIGVGMGNGLLALMLCSLMLKWDIVAGANVM